MDLMTERQHLAKANQDIAEGEERIKRQFTLVEGLRARGQNVTSAEGLLRTLRQTMQGWEEHRELILEAIARLEATPAGTVPPSV